MTGIKGLISVIIPFYNGSAYVSTCVESLQKQTYDNFEAIFINDGSTDHTAEIIAAYQDERFIILHQKKAGVSAARNLGLAHARGEFLAFMDIDDIMEPNMLESQLSAIIRSDADMVLCDYKKSYPSGKEEYISLPWNDQLLDRQQILGALIPWSIWRSEGAIMGSLCRTMIRRSMYMIHKVQLREEVSIAEDLLFMLELYNKAEHIYVHSQCLYQYRIHENSATNLYRVNSLEKNLQFHEIFVCLLKAEGLYEANQQVYRMNKCRMYTSEISNASRNVHATSARRELMKLREELVRESFDWRQCRLSFLYGLSLWLLEHRFYGALYRMYRIKERMRLGKKTARDI